MASNHTTNYNLNQWEATDKVLRTDFNEDNAKIDAALKGLSDQVAGKAAQSAVDALTQSVSGKADAATVAALSQTVSGKADQADVDALTAKAGTQLISRAVLSAAAEDFNLDLSSVDWDQWSTVTILVRPALPVGGEYLLRFNGTENVNYAVVTGPFFGVLLPYFHGAQPVTFLMNPEYNGKTIVNFSLNYADLDSFQILATEGLFQAGTVAEAWGNK